MSEREDEVAAQDGIRTDKAVARAESLRAARTAALARRGAEVDAGVQRRYLVCACGEARYGLVLESAAEVLPMRPCTPVPGAVPALVGLVAISGRIVSVLDLARALNHRATGRRDSESGHLVVLRTHPAGPVALAVDRVLGVAARAVEAGDPSAAGMGDGAVSGYAAAEPASAGDGGFVVLDLARLLRRALP